MRYFELGLGNSVEEDWETFDYSICIKGLREPNDFEEANKFIAKDLEQSLVLRKFRKKKQKHSLIGMQS